jgi:hypothetical protein
MVIAWAAFNAVRETALLTVVIPRLLTLYPGMVTVLTSLCR